MICIDNRVSYCCWHWMGKDNNEAYDDDALVVIAVDYLFSMIPTVLDIHKNEHTHTHSHVHSSHYSINEKKGKTALQCVYVCMCQCVCKEILLMSM